MNKIYTLFFGRQNVSVQYRVGPQGTVVWGCQLSSYTHWRLPDSHLPHFVVEIVLVRKCPIFAVYNSGCVGSGSSLGLQPPLYPVLAPPTCYYIDCTPVSMGNTLLYPTDPRSSRAWLSMSVNEPALLLLDSGLMSGEWKKNNPQVEKNFK